MALLYVLVGIFVGCAFCGLFAIVLATDDDEEG
jgi:hypothetical protein